MKKCILWCALIANTFTLSAQEIDYQSLKHNHDLSLPDWGPYTKQYMGISHITDVNAGTRFDLSIFPGLYRRKVEIPHANHESGFHAWEAAPNLDYFSFRHELEWKDQLYTDISYSNIDESARLVKIECVNNTEYPQNIVVHMMASMHFQRVNRKEQRSCSIIEPSTIPWIDGEDYSLYKCPTISYLDHLMTDGQIKGAMEGEEFIGSKAFKPSDNSYATYQVEGINSETTTLCVRYTASSKVAIQLSGVVDKTISLEPTDVDEGVKLVKIEIEPNLKSRDLTLTFGDNPDILIDGLALLSRKQAEEIAIKTSHWEHFAEEIEGPIKNSIILKYPGIDKYYGISWNYDDYIIRRYQFGSLDEDFKKLINEHVRTSFNDGSGTDMSYLNIFMRPIFIDPNSTEFIDGVVCCGDTQQEVAENLKRLEGINKDNIYAKARESLVKFDLYPEGETYRFSQEMEVANLSSNIVFPIDTQSQYIRHHTPGRWWNSLYTWDCGFVGIGFSQIDIERAIESLNTYTNDIDEAAAFIHHGSPVPVQMYLFQNIWDATQSREMLEHFYPRLKRYYEFYMARVEGSTMREMKSGLIRTWDYFYNSAGWDDYPAQVACQSGDRYACVANSAHTIRSAKILKMAARELGLKSDIAMYDRDIEELTEALNKYSWDSESGYFSYVVHNEAKEPIGIFRHEDGSNYNKGLDGASPFVADICNDEQQEKILDHLKSPKELWSSTGISTVDQSASYYSDSGYWNGAVWMPHQWFFWRALLDAGEGDFAYKVAKTALNIWKRETDRTYNCYEHFIVKSGCGAGWHQFGGLSTPVLAWYKTYFQKGSFTTGLNIWVKSKAFSDNLDTFEAELQPNKKSDSEFVVVVCMNPDYEYSATWRGKKVRVERLINGVYNIYVPYSSLDGKLVVTKI